MSQIAQQTGVVFYIKCTSQKNLCSENCWHHVNQVAAPCLTVSLPRATQPRAHAPPRKRTLCHTNGHHHVSWTCISAKEEVAASGFDRRFTLRLQPQFRRHPSHSNSATAGTRECGCPLSQGNVCWHCCSCRLGCRFLISCQSRCRMSNVILYKFHYKELDDL